MGWDAVSAHLEERDPTSGCAKGHGAKMAALLLAASQLTVSIEKFYVRCLRLVETGLETLEGTMESVLESLTRT